MNAIVSADRERLARKFSLVSFLTSDPAEANNFRGHILDSYLTDPNKVGEAVDMLMQITHQMWIDSKTQESIRLCERTVSIAEEYGDDRQRKSATLRLVDHLTLVGRLHDAAGYLSRINVDNSDIPFTRIVYHLLRGFIVSKEGQTAAAFADLDRALQYAKEDPHIGAIRSVLTTYSGIAIALGNIERGRAFYEQALLIVRHNRMGWRMPKACLRYADILLKMGRYAEAHGYLLEALSSDAHAQILEELFVSVGIPIAMYLKDDGTLRRCIRPAAIDLAFQSGEPERIGSVVTAFARLYAQQRQSEKARDLLHRALKFITYADDNVDVLLAVAEHGALTDAPVARALLEKRASFPAADVARACILLFDAFIDYRTKNQRVSYSADQAAQHFDRLQWYAYSDLARSLLPLSLSRSSTGTLREQAFSSALPDLTERERQVAELVLKGFKNRAIARQLSIQEHTVEKHMSSIMSRLGLRSRHQLADAMADGAIPESGMRTER